MSTFLKGLQQANPTWYPKGFIDGTNMSGRPRKRRRRGKQWNTSNWESRTLKQEQAGLVILMLRSTMFVMHLFLCSLYERKSIHYEFFLQHPQIPLKMHDVSYLWLHAVRGEHNHGWWEEKCYKLFLACSRTVCLITCPLEPFCQSPLTCLSLDILRAFESYPHSSLVEGKLELPKNLFYSFSPHNMLWIIMNFIFSCRPTSGYKMTVLRAVCTPGQYVQPPACIIMNNSELTVDVY